MDSNKRARNWLIITKRVMGFLILLSSKQSTIYNKKTLILQGQVARPLQIIIWAEKDGLRVMEL